MTAVQDRSADSPTRDGLGPVLQAAHRIWIAQTDRYLAPITVPRASFWERWTAVRYLADEFLAQYRRECKLLEELRSFLPSGVADTLLEKAERLGQLQQDLDRIGRRRGTAATVSGAARLLLELLRAWCTDIEVAAGHIVSSGLPEEAQRVLAELEQFARSHA
jgi:hypothetical protein